MMANHQFNIERVYNFEQELEKKLQDLSRIEKDILVVGSQRKEWLNNITVTEKVESDIFLKKIELIQAQAELSTLNMQLDILKLEGHYETQSLNYLVEATKPIDDFNGKHNAEKREVELLTLARKDNAKIAECLLQSIDYRCRLGNYNYDLTTQLKQMQSLVALEKQSKVEEVKEKLDDYIFKMTKSVEHSKKTHKKITAEYLILRHNARVAKEILLRSQNEAHLARAKLQESLDTMTREAELQRVKMEESSAQEIKLLTSDLRTTVMAKEIEHENLHAKVSRLSKLKKNNFKHLKDTIRAYDKKYNDLQRSRKHDLVNVTQEMRRLKEAIQHSELKLSLSAYNMTDSTPVFGPHVEEELRQYLELIQLEDGPGENPETVGEAETKEDGNATIIRKLKEKLRELNAVSASSNVFANVHNHSNISSTAGKDKKIKKDKTTSTDMKTTKKSTVTVKTRPVVSAPAAMTTQKNRTETKTTTNTTKTTLPVSGKMLSQKKA